MVAMMKRLVNGHGFGPVKLEHALIFILGLACVANYQEVYRQSLSPVGQVMILIVYLGVLVGIAPLPMPVFRSKFAQTFFAGLSSGVVDSYIVLEQVKAVTTVEDGQEDEEVGGSFQAVVGYRAKFLSLITIAALIGGLIIWFGEVYAAGLYNNDGRTDVRSALFVVPPVLIFLTILGLHAQMLPLMIVAKNEPTSVRVKSYLRKNFRYLIGFTAGILGLLLTHNPLLCLGVLLMTAVVIGRSEHALDIIRNHIEISIILVLFIALLVGHHMVDFSNAVGIATGSVAPIIPAMIQAVLWGPIYEDPSVHFWVRLTTLSTGAMILPTSSLVGVMLFKTRAQWLTYMRYSIPYAVLWFLLMHGWINLTLHTSVGKWLETWAHVAAHH